jgi:hypothetical protein
MCYTRIHFFNINRKYTNSQHKLKGTGGTTIHTLEALNNSFSTYTYTDISASFFEPAKNKFYETRKMTFLQLDIEKDPIEQGV